MTPRKTRAEERIEELDISPAALIAELDELKAERDEARREGGRVPGRAPARARRVHQLQAPHGRGARARARARRRGPHPQGPRSSPTTSTAPSTTAPAALADDAWAEGIAAIDRKLRLLLESEGVTAVEAAPGTPFDPREHEAVVSVPGTGRADGEIVEEIRRGYRLRDRVIRPALVAVAAAGDDVARRPHQLIHPPPRTHPDTRPTKERPRTWARSSASTSGRRTPSSP